MAIVPIARKLTHKHLSSGKLYGHYCHHLAYFATCKVVRCILQIKYVIAGLTRNLAGTTASFEKVAL